MKKTYFNWSTGKDSALALYYLLKDKNYTINLLVTTVNNDFDRVSMHGLRENLLDEQAKSLGLPLQKMYLSGNVSMEVYNAAMKETMQQLRDEKYEYAGFGDIFLEDLRSYREKKLREVGIKAIFPLWKQDTKELMQQFLKLGFKAITVCINAKLLDKRFVGRIIDEEFINDLPPSVDVCGENGEFHTFVFDGPIFEYPIEFEVGEIVLKEYQLSNKTREKNVEKNWDTAFWYCDLQRIPTKF